MIIHHVYLVQGEHQDNLARDIIVHEVDQDHSPIGGGDTGASSRLCSLIFLFSIRVEIASIPPEILDLSDSPVQRYVARVYTNIRSAMFQKILSTNRTQHFTRTMPSRAALSIIVQISSIVKEVVWIESSLFVHCLVQFLTRFMSCVSRLAFWRATRLFDCWLLIDDILWVGSLSKWVAGKFIYILETSGLGENPYTWNIKR